jgi:hypothetical protein
MLPPHDRAQLPPPSQQLLLPFPPLDPVPLSLPPTLATLPAAQIWAGLPAPIQRQVRSTLLRILQEVCNDSQHA